VKRARRTLLARSAFVVATTILVALAVYEIASPEYCPKYAGLVQPERQFCARPDLITGVYETPSDVRFHDSSGNTVEPPSSIEREAAMSILMLVPLTLALAAVQLLVLNRTER
jgi:hypothetical protein